MSKVKLLSNLSTGSGTIEEGSVVALPDDYAAKLVSLGAAEATDETETATYKDEPPVAAPAPYSEPSFVNPTPTEPQEVETAADPLVEQTDGLLETPTPEEVPALPPTPAQEPAPTPTPEQSTPPAPVSSSQNLHLG